jgi:hypothetical protein
MQESFSPDATPEGEDLEHKEALARAQVLKKEYSNKESVHAIREEGTTTELLKELLRWKLKEFGTYVNFLSPELITHIELDFIHEKKFQ